MRSKPRAGASNPNAARAWRSGSRTTSISSSGWGELNEELEVLYGEARELEGEDCGECGHAGV